MACDDQNESHIIISPESSLDLVIYIHSLSRSNNIPHQSSYTIETADFNGKWFVSATCSPSKGDQERSHRAPIAIHLISGLEASSATRGQTQDSIMAPSPPKVLVVVLVVGMLVSGVANTLLTKLQDNAGFEQPVWQTLNMFIGESGCWLVVFAHWLRSYVAQRKISGYEPVTTDDTDAHIEASAGAREGNGIHSHGEGVFGSSVAVAGEEEEDTSPLVKTLSQQEPTELRGKTLFLLALPSTCDIMGTTLVNVGLIMVPASIYQMVRGFLVVFVGLFSVVFLKRRLTLSQWGGLFLVVLGVSLVGNYPPHRNSHTRTLWCFIQSSYRLAS